MITVTYEFFKFKEPRLLTKEEFLKAKEVLAQFPKADIMPPFSFYEEKKPIMTMLLIGIIPAIFMAIFGESNIKNGLFQFVAVIFSLYLAVCGITIIIWVVPEYINFSRAKAKLRTFYTKLYQDLIMSSNYDEFLKRQKGSF